MTGGSRIRTAALAALAVAALAGGACTHSTSPVRTVPAPAGVFGGLIAQAPDYPDPAVTDAPGGVTDGHRPEDLPAVTAAQATPSTAPATDTAPAEADAPAD
jgi:hypothetical protein